MLEIRNTPNHIAMVPHNVGKLATLPLHPLHHVFSYLDDKSEGMLALTSHRYHAIRQHLVGLKIENVAIQIMKMDLQDDNIPFPRLPDLLPLLAQIPSSSAFLPSNQILNPPNLKINRTLSKAILSISDNPQNKRATKPLIFNYLFEISQHNRNGQTYHPQIYDIKKLIKRAQFLELSQVPRYLYCKWIFKNLVQNGFKLNEVPPAFRDEDVCLEAVKRNGNALQYVPIELQTPTLCRVAVEQDGCALMFVPLELRDYTMARIAVSKNGKALEYVPKELLDEDLCIIAVSNYGKALRFVPNPQKTPKVCLAAVKNCGDALHEVPNTLRNIEICIVALQNNGSLNYVPPELRDREMCRHALNVPNNNLQFVPKIHRKWFLKEWEQLSQQLEDSSESD